MFETMVTVVGNIVDTPQRRVLDTGVSVTNFRVAATAKRFDRESGDWVDRETFYVKVNCWRMLADNVARSLVHGDPVVVSGRIYTREWEKDGQRRSTWEMEAEAVGPNLRWGQADFTRLRRRAEGAPMALRPGVMPVPERPAPGGGVERDRPSSEFEPVPDSLEEVAQLTAV